MTLVTRRTDTGLHLREHTWDEGRVAACLKQIDDRLTLWPPDGMSRYYRVVRQWSDDHPATVIVSWMDPVTAEPLPLSSGIVDEVQKWRPENRDRRGPSAEELNERQRELARRLHDEVVDDIKDDHRGKLARGRVTVAVSSRASKPSWLRNTHLPDSVRRY